MLRSGNCRGGSGGWVASALVGTLREREYNSTNVVATPHWTLSFSVTILVQSKRILVGSKNNRVIPERQTSGCPQSQTAEVTS